MTVPLRPCPPFTYPADFLPSTESTTHASAPEHVEDATLAHRAMHRLVSVPYCEWCIAGERLPDPYRLGKAANALGNPADYADVIEVVNEARAAAADDGEPFDDQAAAAIADQLGLDAATLDLVLEHEQAADELERERFLTDDPRAVALSRFTRIARKNLGRLPAITYAPELDDGGPLDGYAGQVAAEALRLRVREDARDLYARQKAAREPADPFDAGSLGEVLARPAEPPYRVDKLIPSDAGALVVAQRKIGKTTWNLNLARALLTGENFLGRFAVRPVAGAVAILNFEVGGAQLARWADDVGIDHGRLFLVNLRGRRNPLANPTDRAALAAWLRVRGVETLIVDPFGRAYTGTSQNDAGEVGAWLQNLDQFARGEVGARDVILNAHAGWSADSRSRGSTALEDWADTIITLTKGTDDDASRYMKALGRDVDLDEDGLTFDAATRTLSLAGSGSRHAKATRDRSEYLVNAVYTLVATSPGMNGAMVEAALRRANIRFQKGAERAALAVAVDRGILTCQAGPNNAKHYYPAKPPQASPSLPAGVTGSHPTPLIEGGGSRGGSQPQAPQLDLTGGQP